MKMTNPEKVGLSSSKLNLINDLAASYVNKGHMAGTVTLVARHDRVVHFECQGKLNLETGQDMREDTIFRIYSMSKPVTALATMILYERGLLDLDQPVSDFIPSIKNMEVYVSGEGENIVTRKADREITIRDLLTHTSGIPYGIIADTPVDRLYLEHVQPMVIADRPIEEIVDMVAKMPLMFSPGERWCYGMSSDVLGSLIQVITGEPLDQFMDKNIFRPLGMLDTGFYVPEEKKFRFKTLYMHRNGLPKNVQELYPDQILINRIEGPWGFFDYRPTMMSGGGGLVSTATDYLKFATMMLHKGKVGDDYLVKPETIEMMTTNQLPGDLEHFASPELKPLALPGIGYGFGIGIVVDPSKTGGIGSKGTFQWGGAAHTTFFVDPKEEMIGIFLTAVFPQLMFDTDIQFRKLVYNAVE